MLDAIAARQVSNPMLRFGGEDAAAEIDPTTYSNVLGADPIAAGDLGLRNIDRVMSFIVPATTRTGESYDKLSAMYEALVGQRHRELIYVARMVGGVEETRYQAGRGKAPFVPVAPARQKQAIAFLNQRAFIEPKALLDPDVIDRVAPGGGSDPLQGSNVDLMRRLIDPDVFKRMMDASSRGNGRYTGLELLYDLNQGLFSELQAKAPVISPYRRQVQRSYVTVLLVATGVTNDPSSSRGIQSEKSLDSEQADSGSRRAAKSNLRATRSFDSALAGVGEQYTASAESLSEYRAVIRTAVAALYKQIDAALATTQDLDTQMHLRLIRAELGNVP